MSLARKILGNTFAQVAGRFATALLAVIVVKILTVYLGQAGYGRYATIYEFLAFFGAFADFGIFTIAVREMSRDKAKEAMIFGNALALRTLFTSGALLVAAGAAFLVPQYQGTVIPLGVAIAALSTFFVIMAGTFSAALQVRLRMEIAAVAMVTGKMLTVLLILWITRSWYPDASEDAFFWLIWAGTVGGAITFALTALWTWRLFPVRLRFDPAVVKMLLYESAPYAVALALNTFYIRIDILLLSLFLPQSADGVCAAKFCGDIEVGAMAVAARIMEIMLMVPIYFMNSVLPTLTTAITEKSERTARVLRHAFSFLLATGIPAGMLMFLLARQAAGFISAEEFLSVPGRAGADTAIQILGGMVMMAFCSMFFGFLLIALGKQRTLIWINLLAVSFNFVADLWAIPRYGFVGAAYASLISEAVMLSLMVLFAKKAYPLRLDLGAAAKIIACGLLAGITAYFVRNALIDFGTLITLFGAGITYALVFFAGLKQTGVLSAEILGMLRK